MSPRIIRKPIPVLIDIVEIKMSRLPGSPLHHQPGIEQVWDVNIHIIWNNNDTTRVLTCRLTPATWPDGDLSITVKLLHVNLWQNHKPSDLQQYLLFQHNILLSKNITNIRGLMVDHHQRKVQIDIRTLSPVKPGKSRKDILTIFFILISTFWTLLVRAVEARSIGAM